MAKKVNGTTNEAKPVAAPAAPAAGMDPEIAAKIAAVRTHIRESFGKVVMAMMALPRYRHQTLADLQLLVLEPLMRNRVAIAYADENPGPLSDMVGFGIWANVSEEVHARIREQIQAGTFPIRLKPDDWTSGNINWLLDVVATDQKTTTTVVANFKRVVKEGSLFLHPQVAHLVSPENLEKMGAEKITDQAADAVAPEPATAD